MPSIRLTKVNIDKEQLEHIKTLAVNESTSATKLLAKIINTYLKSL